MKKPKNILGMLVAFLGGITLLFILTFPFFLRSISSVAYAEILPGGGISGDISDDVGGKCPHQDNGGGALGDCDDWNWCFRCFEVCDTAYSDGDVRWNCYAKGGSNQCDCDDTTIAKDWAEHGENRQKWENGDSLQGGDDDGKKDCNESAAFCGTNVKAFVEDVIAYGGPILGGLAILKIIFGGIMYATAGGNPQRITSAKSHISYALIGLTLLIAMNVILILLGASPY